MIQEKIHSHCTLSGKEVWENFVSLCLLKLLEMLLGRNKITRGTSPSLSRSRAMKQHEPIAIVDSGVAYCNQHDDRVVHIREGEELGVSEVLDDEGSLQQDTKQEEPELYRVSDRATPWCEWEAYRASGWVDLPANDGICERTGRRRSMTRGNANSS